MLLVIAIVGTTIAPWQLFFQQSYVIDKRITPRFIGYESADLWIGIVLVMIGARRDDGLRRGGFRRAARNSATSPMRRRRGGIENYAGRDAPACCSPSR